MPFIHVKTNAAVPEDKERAMKTKLGKAIEILPGKSEQWLMLDFSDGQRMYFQGDNSQPIAMVEVKIYGKAPSGAYDKLTAAITRILGEELSLSADHIYVKYEEAEYWGWNGGNF